MKTFLFVFLAALSFAFTSCMKEAFDYEPAFGTKLNTWTFNDGVKIQNGHFLEDPILHTTIQNNNTYTLELNGMQSGTGLTFNTVISLSDLDFAVKSYQSGIPGSDHFTSFHFSGTAGSRDPIFFSSNNDPGAIMNFTIENYNASENTVTITFSGEAFDVNGHLVSISNGKMTAQIVRK